MTSWNNEIEHNRSAHNIVASSYNGKHAEIYNEFEQSRLRALIQHIIGSTKKNVGDLKVLDFGAGTGNLSRIFVGLGCKVTACDVSTKSLELLKENLKSKELEIVAYDGTELPFADNVFDITATYSVLHHIPDYLAAVREMIRVTKPGGIIYIDHEANINRWKPPQALQDYYAKTKQTKLEHLKKLVVSGELFTWGFIKTPFILLFNKRYRREGDIHVWPDDHIEWEKLISLCTETCLLLEEKDYLMYKPKMEESEYQDYSNLCNDTKYVLFQKK